MRKEKYKDPITLKEMSRFLSKKIGSCEIKIYDSLGSTNTTAKELAFSGAKNGTIILAERQTAGRGRYNRSFYSPEGCGVYMSIILRPEQALRDIPVPTLVTAYAAVAICKAIETTTSIRPQIKWVNDIFVDNKKVCGILTEAVTANSAVPQCIIVGAGINFTEPKGGFPNDLKDIAGALFNNDDKNIDKNNDRDIPFITMTVTRARLAAEIINNILEYDIFDESFNSESLLNDYKKRLMTLGGTITVKTANTPPYNALAVDIDAQGRLIVEKEDGEIVKLAFGEIYTV